MGFKWDDLSPELRKKLRGLKAEIKTTRRRKRPRRAKPKASSDKDRLVKIFLSAWADMEGPKLEREYAFAARCTPPRKWRFDFYHTCGVAVEIDGGIFMRGGGRHNRGLGMAKDHDKFNAAAAMGLCVFRLTEIQLRDGQNIERIIQTIHGRTTSAGDN